MKNNKSKETRHKILALIGSLILTIILFYIVHSGEVEKSASPQPFSADNVLFHKFNIGHFDNLIELESNQDKLIHLVKENIRNNGEWKTFHGTFYVSTCDGCTGLTYHTGWDVRNTIYSPNGYRIVAVDPDVIPLGSLLKVRYGDTQFTARAMDVGSAINGYDVDILVDDESKAFRLGTQEVEMKILRGDES